MDLKNRHPLNAINGYESLSMLEALIPFVEYPLKLPLALFIKFSEIRLIILNFRSIETLTRLGLHNPASDPMDMVCALTGISPDILKMLFSMMENNGNLLNPDLLSHLAGMDGSVFSNPDALGSLFANTNSFNTTNLSNTNSFNANLSNAYSSDTNACESVSSNPNTSAACNGGMDFANLAGLFQGMQTGFGNNFNSGTQTDFGNHSNSGTQTGFGIHSDSSMNSYQQPGNRFANNTDSFDENIQNILAKYDLQQAEALDASSKNTGTDFLSSEYDNVSGVSPEEYDHPSYFPSEEHNHSSTKENFI